MKYSLIPVLLFFISIFVFNQEYAVDPRRYNTPALKFYQQLLRQNRQLEREFEQQQAQPNVQQNGRRQHIVIQPDYRNPNEDFIITLLMNPYLAYIQPELYLPPKALVTRIQSFLNGGADVNITFVHEHELMTPLVYAIETGQDLLAQLFIQHNAQLVVPSSTLRYTALHLAARLGNANLTRLLLNHRPELAIIQDNDGNTPLHEAARSGNTDVINLLLHAGASGVINTPTQGHETPISITLTYNNLPAAALLMWYGAELF